MRYTLIAAMMLVLTLPVLGGCGQMGPLYMPAEEEKLSKPVEQTSETEQETDAL